MIQGVYQANQAEFTDYLAKSLRFSGSVIEHGGVYAVVRADQVKESALEGITRIPGSQWIAIPIVGHSHYPRNGGPFYLSENDTRYLTKEGDITSLLAGFLNDWLRPGASFGITIKLSNKDELLNQGFISISRNSISIPMFG